jgi:hypothetical protein
MIMRLTYKKVIITLLLFVSTINGCTQTNQNSTDNYFISKEYKLLIRGDIFTDRLSGYNKMCDIFENNFSNHGYSIKLTRSFLKEKQKSIEYFDTKSNDFLNNNLVLKKITKVKKGNESYELSLKIKSESPQSPEYMENKTRDNNLNVKFEEDVLIQKSDSISFKKVFTEKYSVKDDVIKEKYKVNDLSNVFPLLFNFKINPDSDVSYTYGERIKEYSVKIGKINWGNNLKSNIEVIVWYRYGEQNPLIAEISYRIEIPKDNEKINEITDRCNEFMIKLYNSISDLAVTDKTKTDLIYNYN